jgi:SAM-dependent methyltransferase
VIGWLQRRWLKACSDTIGTERFWSIAVDHVSIRRALAPLISRYASGPVLDAGAGRLAWRALLRAKGETYFASDAAPSHPELSFLCDVQGRIPLRDASIGSIFCCSVMEHTCEPWRILPEFRRVLRTGGHVILSVPFLYYLHGAPYDYFRFTRFGVERLASAAGFEIVEMVTTGGLAHTILQALSMLTTACLWTPHAPLLAAIPARCLATLANLIDRLDSRGVFHQSVNAVLRAS